MRSDDHPVSDAAGRDGPEIGPARDIEIVEVSPRDGLQHESAFVPTEIKAELILRAVAAGARRIEATSFVSPRAVAQMADAEALLEWLSAGADLGRMGVKLIGLVLNRRGIERALACALDELNMVVIASETFSQRNQGASSGESLAAVRDAIPLVRRAGRSLSVTIGASFGCPFEGEVPEHRLAAICRELGEMGVTEIALADSIGVADPLAVEARIRRVRGIVPAATIRCHFHNSRNTGLANVYAAWRAGASSIDASIGGIGGCPFAPGATGNVPTEDVAYMFSRMGIATGYALDALIETSRWLGGVLEKPLPGMLGRAGLFPRPTSDLPRAAVETRGIVRIGNGVQPRELPR